MPKDVYKEIPDELLLHARGQAACLHRRDDVVQEILREAGCRWNARTKAQEKRLTTKAEHPARIYLEEAHLLQHLVFWCSEPHERAQETYAPSSIGERDMIVRYLAFVVRKALRRNSLYGVTGMCRFICRYGLNEVREIHEALLDDPDRYKDDDVYRRNRKRTREMISKRFSRFLRLEETQNGQEKHFQLRDDQNAPTLWQLIRGSLDAFKPWSTECLPADFKVFGEEPGVFRDPDEHACEIKRLHALFHPDCFKHLMESLGFDAPDNRLGIPRFLSVSPFDEDSAFGRGSDGGGPADGRQKLEDLRGMLAEHDEQLKRFVPEGVLAIRVDGEDVADLDLGVTNRVQFALDDEGAELIEIVARGGRLVLAAHLLDDEVWQTGGRKHSYIVRHQNGAKIIFNFRVSPHPETGESRLLVSAVYKETKPLRALTFLSRRMASRFSGGEPIIGGAGESLSPSGLPALATAVRNLSPLRLMPLLLIISLAGGSLVSLLRHSSSPVTVTTNNEPVSKTAAVVEAVDESVPVSVESVKDTRPPKISRPNRPKRPVGRPNNSPTDNLVPETDLASSANEKPNDPTPDNSRSTGPRRMGCVSEEMSSHGGRPCDPPSTRTIINDH